MDGQDVLKILGPQIKNLERKINEDFQPKIKHGTITLDENNCLVFIYTEE